MKIAIPLTNNELSAHFGHCENFAIYTVENGKIVEEEFVDPPVHEPGSHPRFLHELGCSAVIAGGMGIKAQDLMCANQIKVYVGVPNLPLKDLVNSFIEDKLQSGTNLCDH